jgi:hypothetical protein
LRWQGFHVQHSVGFSGNIAFHPMNAALPPCQR